MNAEKERGLYLQRRHFIFLSKSKIFVGQANKKPRSKSGNVYFLIFCSQQPFSIKILFLTPTFEMCVC